MIRFSSRIPLEAMLLAMVLACSCGEKSAAPVPGAVTVADEKLYEDSPYLALDGSHDQMVMINLDLTRQMTFYEKARDAIFQVESRKKWLADVREHLGLDALKDVKRLVIAWKEPLDFEDPLKSAVVIMICAHGSPETFAKGFVKFVDGRYVNTPNPPTKTDYRDVPIFSMMQSTSIENPEQTLDYHLAFPGRQIVVFSRQMAMITPIVDVIKGGAPNLQSRPVWQKRLSGVRFNSVVMGLGLIPASMRDWIQEKVKTDPDYKTMIFLPDGKEFYFSFAYTGRDYEISAAIRCDEISRAQGLQANLEDFRSRGLDAKAIAEWSGMEPARTKVWKKLIDEITISIQGNGAVLDLKMERAAMDRFVDDLIHPPAIAPPAGDAPPAPAPAADELDPFK